MWRKVGPAARIAAGVAVAALFMLPLVWMITGSLRPTGLPPARTIEWWPSDPQLSNYTAIFDMLPMGLYIRNSLIVVLVAVPTTLLTASLAGFGLSQLRQPWQQRLLIYTIVVLMIPAPAVWLFRYQILSWLGLLSSLWALIVPAFAAGSPLLVLLFYWTFRRTPVSFFEAARVEGADAWTAWRRIAMPMARPTTAAVLVLAFALFWNDFTNPVLYLYRPETYTLPIGIQILKQVDSTNWPLMLAGAALITLPMVVLFLALQRQFLHDDALSELLDRG